MEIFTYYTYFGIIFWLTVTQYSYSALISKTALRNSKLSAIFCVFPACQTYLSILNVSYLHTV